MDTLLAAYAGLFLWSFLAATVLPLSSEAALALLEEQHAFVVPSSHAGEPVLRFAIISPLTTFELLTAILDTLE